MAFMYLKPSLSGHNLPSLLNDMNIGLPSFIVVWPLLESGNTYLHSGNLRQEGEIGILDIQSLYLPLQQ